MASLHQQKGDRPGWKIRWRDNAAQKQRGLWLGKMSKRSAETIFRHVSELIRAAETGLRLEAATEIWANELTGKLRDKLLKLELLTGSTKSSTDADKLLEPFLQRFIDNMVDAAANTKKNYLQTKQWLTAFLGDTTRLVDITPADLDRWHRHMKSEGLALSNRNKHIQRARKFFQSAVDDRLLSESPAAKLTQERQPKGMRVDRSRQFFVDPTLTERVLKGNAVKHLFPAKTGVSENAVI